MSLRAPLLLLALLALLAVSAVAQDQSPSWILPLAPAGYGGPGVINPYSNVNPLNPMAAQMEAQATGQTTTSTPQSQLGAAGNSATAPHAFIEVGASHIREETPVPPTPFNHEFGDAFIHPHVMTASPPAHIADVHAYLQKATERTAVDEAMLTAFPEIDGNCVECVVPHVEGQCVCHPARLNCPCEKKEFTAPEMWEDATFRPAEVVEEKPRERGVKVNFVDKLPAAGSLQPTNDVVSSTVLRPNLIELEAPCGCPITSDACVCRKEKPNYVHPEIVEPCENDCEKKSSDKHYFFVKPDHPCGCDTCPCPPPPVQYVAAEVVEKKKKMVCACILQPVCPCAGKF